MIFSNGAAGAGVGNVTVVTTSDGGLSLDHFAERIVDRLIVIAESAPAPIRDQAFAYKEQMYAIVLAGLQQAQASDRAYLLKQFGNG